MLHQAEALPNNYTRGPPPHAEAAVQASLGVARHYIAEGNTTAALQVVFEALRSTFGEGAVHSAAARVESHLSQLHLQPQQASAQSAADQLADILTGCRITDMQAAAHGQSNWQYESLDLQMQQLQLQGQLGSQQQCQSQQPLLQELRGMNLAEPGTMDDSSFVCQRCGGIVSKSRQAAHQQLWCQPHR